MLRLSWDFSQRTGSARLGECCVSCTCAAFLGNSAVLLCTCAIFLRNNPGTCPVFLATLPFSWASAQFSCAVFLAPVPFSWPLSRFPGTCVIFLGICAVILGTCTVLLRSSTGNLRPFLKQRSFPGHLCRFPVHLRNSSAQFSWASVPLSCTPAQFFCAVLR